MKGRSITAIVAVTVAMLGVTGGIAYAAFPNANSEDASTALSAAAASREVLGPQIRGAATRKFSLAKCGPGQSVSGGGYSLASAVGGFQTQGAPAPKAIPVVIESKAWHHGPGSGTNAWGVIAVAPSNFSGTWALMATAMCE
jgi:hypothetical protein